jgi:hypothetical protein
MIRIELSIADPSLYPVTVELLAETRLAASGPTSPELPRVEEAEATLEGSSVGEPERIRRLSTAYDHRWLDRFGEPMPLLPGPFPEALSSINCGGFSLDFQDVLLGATTGFNDPAAIPPPPP